MKAAVLGFGYWGPNIVRNVHCNKHFELAGICSLNEAELCEARRLYPGVRTSIDPEEFIRDETIDAIFIVTPVHTHFNLAMKALKKGKHVFVEKPLCYTLEQGEILKKTASDNGKLLMCGHTFLYTPAVSKIKEIISKHDIGDIYSFDSIRVNLGLFQKNVNVLWDLAVHDLSIMFYLLQEKPVEISAHGTKYKNITPESTAYLSMLFSSGATAHIHVSWMSPVKVRQTTITGMNKMIVYDDMESSEKVKIYDKGIDFEIDDTIRKDFLIRYRSGDIYSPALTNHEALALEVEDFYQAAVTHQDPISSLNLSLDIVSVLDACNVSLQKNGLPVRPNYLTE